MNNFIFIFTKGLKEDLEDFFNGVEIEKIILKINIRLRKNKIKKIHKMSN